MIPFVTYSQIRPMVFITAYYIYTRFNLYNHRVFQILATHMLIANRFGFGVNALIPPSAPNSYSMRTTQSTQSIQTLQAMQPPILTPSLRFFDLNEYANTCVDKKIISISPGGLAGFYMLGVTKYLKEHYELSDYEILGASAGSWNALAMSYNKPIHYLINDIMDNYSHSYYCYENENENNYKGSYYNKDKSNNQEIINNCLNNEYSGVSSIQEIQYNIRSLLLNNYNENEFDLDKINIATTLFTNTGFRQVIVSDMVTLEQAVDSCIASSHIPFITGDLLLKVDDNLFFDGGLKGFPPENINPYFSITPDIWGFKFTDYFKIPHFNKKNDVVNPVNDIDIMSFENLLEKGYDDSRENRKVLDEFFD